MERFDLHLHSNMSDGTVPPETIPEEALRFGVRHIALTDHDNTAGVLAAQSAGRLLGVKVIAGIEIDVEHDCELHMLGLGIDPFSPSMLEFEKQRKANRAERNEKMLQKLDAAGIFIRDVMEHSRGCDTRLHMAKALMKDGYASSIQDAFDRYLNKGAPGYVESRRPSMKEAVDIIHRAGGKAVLAHPCKIKGDVHSLIRKLKDYGLEGLEAYYPTSSEGMKQTFISLAQQLELFLTCGSDFHGTNRPRDIGCSWEDTDKLQTAWDMFFGE